MGELDGPDFQPSSLRMWVVISLCLREETGPEARCYVTVGTFAWCGLGSAKQRHWVVCSGFCMSTKSKEDLGSFWWWVVNLQRNKSSVWRITLRGFRHERKGVLRSIGFYQSTVVQWKKSSLGLQATQYAWLIYLVSQIHPWCLPARSAWGCKTFKSEDEEYWQKGMPRKLKKTCGSVRW